MREPPRTNELSLLLEPLRTFASAYEERYAALRPGRRLKRLETGRSRERADWLFAQGRSEACWQDPKNGARWRRERDATGDPARAFPWRSGAEVTWTLLSRHLDGRAVDYGIEVFEEGHWRYVPGSTEAELLLYQDAVTIGEQVIAERGWKVQNGIWIKRRGKTVKTDIGHWQID